MGDELYKNPVVPYLPSNIILHLFLACGPSSALVRFALKHPFHKSNYSTPERPIFEIIASGIFHLLTAKTHDLCLLFLSLLIPFPVFGLGGPGTHRSTMYTGVGVTEALPALS